MPRELTHVAVALKVVDALPPGPLKTAAQSHEDALLLGSIFHDVGYYQVRGSARYDLGRLADALHGTAGEDTFDVLRLLTKDNRQTTSSPVLLAFLAGLTTHIATDQAFHPAVYYLTGNYYDADSTSRARAVEAHRALEVVLDLVICNGLVNLASHRLGGWIRSLGTHLPQLVRAVAVRIDGERSGQLSSTLLESLVVFARIQKLFRNVRLMSSLDKLRPIMPDSLRIISALGYTSRRQEFSERFFGAIEYRHPVTGVKSLEVVGDLMQRAVSTALGICSELTEALHTGMPPLMSAKGASLEVGLADTAVQRARIFHPWVDSGDHQKILEEAS